LGLIHSPHKARRFARWKVASRWIWRKAPRKDDSAMMYVRELSAEDFQILKEISRKEVGRVSQRAHIVLMSAKTVAVPTIATLFDVSAATVRFWIRKFESEGPKGLFDESRSGRPRNGNGNGTSGGTDRGTLERSLRNFNRGKKSNYSFPASCSTNRAKF